MKLKVLVDNNTYIDQYYYGEPGVCYYMEDCEVKLLLDTGYSSIFLDNAEAMGVDLAQLDGVILSHGHNDHTGGLSYLLERRLWEREREATQGDEVKPGKKLCLVAHPGALAPKYCDGQEIGSALTAEQAAKACRVILTKDPLRLSKNITFLGEIPRVIESGISIGTTAPEGKEVEDFLLDDSALVYQGKDGIYIITGCSHSGICNIIERAKAVTGQEKVCGVIGGFHLFDAESDETLHVIEYLKKQEIPQLYPCHCVSFAVKCAINQKLPIGDVGVGLELEWE